MKKIIASYLPYNVKVVNNVAFQEFGLCKNTVEELRGLVLDHVYANEENYVYTDVDDFNVDDCRLILRPLSDLDKNITHNGKTFHPIKELIKMPITKESNALMAFYNLNTIGVGKYLEDVANYGDINPKYLSYPLAQKLIEWHFDINGLIEKGLAININDLKEDLK